METPNNTAQNFDWKPIATELAMSHPVNLVYLDRHGFKVKAADGRTATFNYTSRGLHYKEVSAYVCGLSFDDHELIIEWTANFRRQTRLPL